MGRPERLTPERQERFLKAIRTGAFPEVAAAYAGFSSASYYRYRHGVSRQHASFRREVLRAESELELELVGRITLEAGSSARWALALLERRFPKRWGPRANPDDAAEVGDVGVRPGEPINFDPALIDRLLGSLEAMRPGTKNGQPDLDIGRFEEQRPGSGREVGS
jgi:hypothetical protein